MAEMRFELLGSLRVVAAAVPGGPAPRSELSLGGPKQRLVLARLLAEPNQVVSLDRLVDGLWGDDPARDGPPHAPGLRVGAPQSGRTTDRARRRGLPDPCRSRRARQPRVRSSGRPRHGALAATDPGGCGDRARSGARRSGAARPSTTSPEPALHAEAARLEELRLAVFEELMHARLAAGQHADVIVAARAADARAPVPRGAAGAAHDRAVPIGSPGDALRAFQATREVLGEELGIVPSPRLRRLEEQILLQDPDLDPRRRARHAAAGEPLGREPLHGSPRVPRGRSRRGSSGRTSCRAARRTASSGTAPFTALVGPSGSGKSSVVQAGLIPRLRRDHPDLIVAPDAARLPAVRRARGRARAAARRRRARCRPPAGVGRRPAVCSPRCRPIVATARRGCCSWSTSSRSCSPWSIRPRRPASSPLLAETAADPRRPGPRARHVAGRLLRPAARRSPTGPAVRRQRRQRRRAGPDELEAAATLPARQLDIAVEPRLVGG